MPLTSKEEFSLHPIGVFRGVTGPHHALAPQPGLPGARDGLITLRAGANFETALADLAGFSHIWVLFWFHEAEGWRPKVQPPLREGRRGVFATRAPHRPNPIGLSCLPLVAVRGRVLEVAQADLLDGTPILDLKPYLPYADARPQATTGWVGEAPAEYSVTWVDPARAQRAWLLAHGVDLTPVDGMLALRARPRRGHRVVDGATLPDGVTSACLASGTWRVHFLRDEAARAVTICSIASGHDAATLAGAPSRWTDVAVHREFLRAWAIPVK